MVILLWFIVLVWAKGHADDALHSFGQYPHPKLQHRLHKRHQSSAIPGEGRSRKLRGEAWSSRLQSGEGTHYTVAYVGTPLVPQSLIVTTGSRYSAFPCTGCTNCGQHIYPYYDPAASSSAMTLSCNGTLCQWGETFSEGSSWRGYKVADRFLVYDPSSMNTSHALKTLAMNFTFFCQSTATGYFVSQRENGLLTLSNAPDAYPNQLMKNKVVSYNVFTLCLHEHGGVISFGGVNSRLHEGRQPRFVPLTQSSTRSYLYLLPLQGLGLSSPTGRSLNITQSDHIFQSGARSALIESGTTDTFLPHSLAHSFFDAVADITNGVRLDATSPITLTYSQRASLPDIVFRFKSMAGENTAVQVNMAPSQYLRFTGQNHYELTLSFTQPDTGAISAILGANFLQDQDVIIDNQAKRVGFVRANCDLLNPATTFAPSPAPSAPPHSHEVSSVCSLHHADGVPTEPVGACSAQCTPGATVTIDGSQQLLDCVNSTPDHQYINSTWCREYCANGVVVRGDAICPDTAWSSCRSSCVRTRVNGDASRGLGHCALHTDTAVCYFGQCPRHQGDVVVKVNMTLTFVGVSHYSWSYVHTEAVASAFAAIFPVLSEHYVDVQVSVHYTYIQLVVSMAFLAESFPDNNHALSAGFMIKQRIEHDRVKFAALLLGTLDRLDLERGYYLSPRRFGFLSPSRNVNIQAVFVEQSHVDDTTTNEQDETSSLSLSSLTSLDVSLIFLAITASFFIGVMVYLHCKLRRDYVLLERPSTTTGEPVTGLRRWFSWRRSTNPPATASRLMMIRQSRTMNLNHEDMEGDFSEHRARVPMEWIEDSRHGLLPPAVDEEESGGESAVANPMTRNTDDVEEEKQVEVELQEIKQEKVDDTAAAPSAPRIEEDEQSASQS